MLKQLELQWELDELEKWFKQNPKLPEEIDRRLLIRFMKCMSNDVEATKKLIEINYSIRNSHPNIFINRDPQDEMTKKTQAASDVVILPGLTPERYKVLLYRLIDYDASKLNSVEECKIFFMTADCRFTMTDVEPESNSEDLEADMAEGDVQIVDIAGYTMSHMYRISIMSFRTYMKFLQEAFPVRLKAMHIINCPSFLDKMVAFLKPFINDEVYKMMHFHSHGLDSLYEHIPRDMLPQEYGGKAGKMSELKSKWTQILNDKRKYLMDPKQWIVKKAERKSRWFFF